MPRVSPGLRPLLAEVPRAHGGEDGQAQPRQESRLEDAHPDLLVGLVEPLVELPHVVADPGVLKAKGGQALLVLQQLGLERGTTREFEYNHPIKSKMISCLGQLCHKRPG